jgi:ethanolaminephosphotransferase
MFVLTDQDKHYIRTYKYHGGDLSPVYKYVLSPFAQWCVDTFIPTWMAPNVITFAGLLLVLCTTAITLYINPTLSPYHSPRWVGLMNCFALLAYQTLDNMDGKQARKTGSSSALGMFFDHGCDAINAGVTILAVGSVLGTGFGGKLFITYLSSWIPFYFQTWEEYYTGSMLLPPFNGPTEGILMAAGSCLVAFFIGTDQFHKVCQLVSLLFRS